eukprot:scaffold53827_cov46-Prasinocladus_malaysianus.AAC.3
MGISWQVAEPIIHAEPCRQENINISEHSLLNYSLFRKIREKVIERVVRCAEKRDDKAETYLDFWLRRRLWDQPSHGLQHVVGLLCLLHERLQHPVHAGANPAFLIKVVVIIAAVPARPSCLFIARG